MMRLASNCVASDMSRQCISLTSIHSHCHPIHSLLTTLKMPYPQFTFAQQSQSAHTPQVLCEQATTSRAHCSDRRGHAVTELAGLAAQTYTHAKTAATTSVSSIREPQTTPQTAPTSLFPSQSQPINMPHRSQIAETVQAISCHPPNYTYKCTLCWKEKEPPCYTIGTESRIVCMDCWRWVHSVSICWKCNEVVYRKEDAISFGWC
jgi:hypothetical protein